jgi:hypothetical protein
LPKIDLSSPFHRDQQSDRIKPSNSSKTQEEALALLKAVEVGLGNPKVKSSPWDPQISDNLRKTLSNHAVR